MHTHKLSTVNPSCARVNHDEEFVTLASFGSSVDKINDQSTYTKVSTCMRGSGMIMVIEGI